MTNPWQALSTHEVYSNPWIRVREDQVINPSGGPGIYGVVEYKNRAVGVIPIDEEGHTWLVGQYRYTHNLYEWEIPEGGCPVGEELIDTAKRELLEEIAKRGDKSIPEIADALDKTKGMVYQHLKELKDNGYVDEKFYITDAGRMALL